MVLRYVWRYFKGYLQQYLFDLGYESYYGWMLCFFWNCLLWFVVGCFFDFLAGCTWGLGGWAVGKAYPNLCNWWGYLFHIIGCTNISNLKLHLQFWRINHVANFSKPPLANPKIKGLNHYKMKEKTFDIVQYVLTHNSHLVTILPSE